MAAVAADPLLQVSGIDGKNSASFHVGNTNMAVGGKSKSRRRKRKGEISVLQREFLKEYQIQPEADRELRNETFGRL